MTYTGIAISWMILSPIGFFTDVAAIVIISHYFPLFHGSDVTLVSFMVAMAGNALFVVPTPAYLELREKPWTSGLCTGYVWCSLTCRLAHILSLLVISIHWSTLLKMSTQKKKYFSTKFLKITIVFIWVSSAVFGLFPLIGVSNEDFAQGSSCTFLAYNIGSGYGIFFFIIILTAMFVSVLCSTDAMVMIKHIKRIAKTKYQAVRFHLPGKRADLPLHGNSSLAERYHRLQFASDLSRFTLVFVLLSFLGNHLPYAVIQALQIFTQTDRTILEVISVYLVGFEALLLPHTMWLFSRRYRHALTYQWQVHILRNKDKEEDEPFSCTLQSYRQNERDKVSLGQSRPPSSLSRTGHAGDTGTIRSTRSEILNKDHVYMNGQSDVTVINSDVGRIQTPRTTNRRMNGIINGEVYVEKPPSIYDERAIDTYELEYRDQLSLDISKPKVRKASNESIPSVKSEQVREPSSRHDVFRSSSARSRRDWKERMRKKNLPPIFVNEAFDDKSPSSDYLDKQVTLSKQGTANISGNSINFYMSSDYHPDCLTEGLSRRKLEKGVSSESEMGEAYNTCDIDEVLDDESVTEMQVVKAKAAYAYRDHDNGEDALNSKENGINTQNIYNTFEDLSKMFLREDSEVVLQEGQIEINAEGESMKTSSVLPKTIDRVSFSNAQKQFTSFKPEPAVERKRSFKNNPFATYNQNKLLSGSYNTEGGADQQAGRLESRKLSENTRPNYGQILDVNEFVNRNTVIKDSQERYLWNSDDVSTSFSVNVNATNSKNIPVSSRFGGNGSVTITPYEGEERFKPWMINYDQNFDEHSEIGEPLIPGSDTSRRELIPSNYMYNNFDANYLGLSDNLCMPMFDENTDRGFQEALEMHVSANSSVFDGGGVYFESIEEEPEDVNSSGSNPFLNQNDYEDKFRTQAVISHSANSRTSSFANANASSRRGSPLQNKDTHISSSKTSTHTLLTTPKITSTDIDSEFEDSGFTSGPERCNASKSAEYTALGRNSPWPDEEIDQNVNMTFDSDFLSTFSRSIDNHYDCAEDGFEIDFKPYENKKPVHKLIEAVKSGHRPHPIRVRSLERTSPDKKPLRRGHSFEDPSTIVKPVYF